MADGQWTKGIPKADGDYYSRIDEYDKSPTPIRIERGKVYEFGCAGDVRREHEAEEWEYLGPITAADAEQLIGLRAEFLKGICVYCGEIQQYESLEQKSGEEGNQIRVEHIKKCRQRPELRLIAYCEALQAACQQFVHWYAEDSTEEKRDNAYDAAVAALALPESLSIRAAKQQ